MMVDDFSSFQQESTKEKQDEEVNKEKQDEEVTNDRLQDHRDPATLLTGRKCFAQVGANLELRQGSQ